MVRKKRDEDKKSRTVKATKKIASRVRESKAPTRTVSMNEPTSNVVDRQIADAIMATLTPSQFALLMKEKAIPATKEEMPNEYMIEKPGGYTWQTGPYTPPAPAVNPAAPAINPAYANAALGITSPAKVDTAKAKFVPTTNPAEVPAQYYVQQPDGSIITVNKAQQPAAPTQPVAQPTAPVAPSRQYPYNPQLPDVYYMHQPDGSVVAVNNKTGETSPAPASAAAIGSSMLKKGNAV